MSEGRTFTGAWLLDEAFEVAGFLGADQDLPAGQVLLQLAADLGDVAGNDQFAPRHLLLEAAFLDELGDAGAGELAGRPGGQHAHALALGHHQPGADAAILDLARHDEVGEREVGGHEYRGIGLGLADGNCASSPSPFQAPSIPVCLIPTGTDFAGQTTMLDLSTIVKNTSTAKEMCVVRWQILDMAGKVVATAESPAVNIVPHSEQRFSAKCSIVNPAIWSLEKPNLYYAVASVEAENNVRDRERVMFGVRILSWDTDQGFSLNHEKTVIKGTCNHQDHAGVGVALPDRLQSFRLEVLKGMDCNAIRTSHNFPTPELIDACARLGVLVLCETRTMSSNDEAMGQLEKMIKRYRNNPAVFLWSLGNEEWYMRGAQDNDEWRMRKDEAGRVISSMQERTHELDPTRLCTAAVNGYYKTDLADALDVVGFSYNLSKIDDYRAEHPKRLLIGTETASECCTRGTFTTDRLRNWMSSYDEFRPGASLELARAWWHFYAARPWLTGGFAWTGFDYRGEPSPYSWPSISSQFGIVDTCGFPKDNFYYYKACWSAEPVLHLYPHWNWEGREGEEILVQVKSNLESVELFLNGRSLGSKKVEPHFTLGWRVHYAPGVLEAHGTKDGKVVTVEKRETAGAPAKIVLTADREEIMADGQDVAMIRVEVVDMEDRPVPTADNLIQFKVGGEGSLIGVGNGDPNCHGSDKGNQRSLFNGLAQAILQATLRPGSLTIDAASEGLKPAVLVISTRHAKALPTVL